MPPEATISRTVNRMGDETAIVIAGAGIAGLTLALELARRGIASTVLERAPALHPVGAGIQLSANALRVFDRLGLLAALRAVATSAATVDLRSAHSGRIIARVPVTAGDGTGYLALHRGDLQRVLLDAVERSTLVDRRLGREIVGLAAASDGIDLSVMANEETGRRDAGRYRPRLLVAADGVHSTIAARLGLPPARDSGVVAWRAQIDAQALRPQTSIEAWLGPRRHAVVYPVEAGRRTNLVLVERPPASGPDPRPGDKPSLLARFANWNPALLERIAAAEQLTAWPMFETPADRPWRHFDDRLVLIGDAAHAMLPYAAQGAAMAIEDAAVLAAELANAIDYPGALAAYEAQRRPRIDRVRRRVGFHRLVYHLPFPAALARDVALAARSPQSLSRDLAWLYDWMPPEGAGPPGA